MRKSLVRTLPIRSRPLPPFVLTKLYPLGLGCQCHSQNPDSIRPNNGLILPAATPPDRIPSTLRVTSAPLINQVSRLQTPSK